MKSLFEYLHVKNHQRTRQTLLIVLFAASPADFSYADATESVGHIEVIQASGKKHYLPTVSSRYEVEIAGDLATVTLVQRFRNDLDRAVHAEYLFPLNKDAAVFDMQMLVGDERIQARIDRVEEATKTFEEAKSEGKSAALMKQYRPNMFTQSIANLAPTAPITVTLKYVQSVTRIDQRYELVLPLVVGPRYRSVDSTISSTQPDLDPNSSASFGRWELSTLPSDPTVIIEPASENHANPSQREGDVTIDVRINGGVPISNVSSDSHQIVEKQMGENIVHVNLSDQHVPANRDFRLYYQLADTMSGEPLRASKMFMRKALRGLRPTDRFRIIRFSDVATEFSQSPLAATKSNISHGLRYIDGLQGSGGTEMSSGIIQALIQPGEEGVMRIVSFLTDGYIGDDAEIIELIHTHLGKSRLMAFGVGSAPNRYLLSEMGRVGRGFSRYLDPTDDYDSVTTDLVARLQSPVLTDINIDWKGLKPTEVYPRRIPDLFAGQSVRVQGRYAEPGTHEIRVNGNIRGAKSELPIQATLPAVSGDGKAIGLTWARAAIADRMRQLTVAQSDGEDTNLLKEAVIKFGLDFSLVTQWTAFVAVSEKIYNTATETTDNLSIANHQVAGVSKTAYAQHQTFVGHGTPEPGVVIGLLLVLSISLFYYGFLPGQRNRTGSRQ